MFRASQVAIWLAPLLVWTCLATLQARCEPHRYGPNDYMCDDDVTDRCVDPRVSVEKSFKKLGITSAEAELLHKSVGFVACPPDNASGFILQGGRYLLTNAHVMAGPVAEHRSCDFVTVDGKLRAALNVAGAVSFVRDGITGDAAVGAQAWDDDLALVPLKTPNPQLGGLPLSDNPFLVDTGKSVIGVTAYAYRPSRISEDDLVGERCRTSTVLPGWGYGRDDYDGLMISSSCYGVPGVSGSPILSRDGSELKVVAVHARGIDFEGPTRFEWGVSNRAEVPISYLMHRLNVAIANIEHGVPELPLISGDARNQILAGAGHLDCGETKQSRVSASAVAIASDQIVTSRDALSTIGEAEVKSCTFRPFGVRSPIKIDASSFAKIVASDDLPLQLRPSKPFDASIAIPLAGSAVYENTRLVMVTWSAANRKSALVPCEVTQSIPLKDGNFLYLTCTQAGRSGAPLFAIRDGRLTTVGVVVNDNQKTEAKNERGIIVSAVELVAHSEAVSMKKP